MYLFESEFLDTKQHLWHPSILDGISRIINDFIQSDEPESKEKCLKDFIFEVQDARTTFLRDMKDLNIIMKCRVKCDNNAHFGGQECSKLMASIINAAEKYMQNTSYGTAINLSTVSKFIDKIRRKARDDQSYARKFELDTKRDYLTYGTDKTLEIFRESGYEI